MLRLSGWYESWILYLQSSLAGPSVCLYLFYFFTWTCYFKKTPRLDNNTLSETVETEGVTKGCCQSFAVHTQAHAVASWDTQQFPWLDYLPQVSDKSEKEGNGQLLRRRRRKKKQGEQHNTPSWISHARKVTEVAKNGLFTMRVLVQCTSCARSR